MTIKEVKAILENREEIQFELASGEKVPPHFHVTEVGEVNKKFIDCGGTIRDEKKANFQLWTADDVDHRLSAKKLLSIIKLSEKQLFLSEHLEVEVEYQSTTIGKYELTFENEKFVLQPTLTDCLAKDKCGIPENKIPRSKKPKMKLSEFQKMQCEPNSGCC
ncbi:MAG: DUF6428 family protein [Flavobacteriaceae bacterium]|nr:DUF6428 family protein [Flavobacteriaceae bacterium]